MIARRKSPSEVRISALSACASAWSIPISLYSMSDNRLRAKENAVTHIFGTVDLLGEADLLEAHPG